MTDIELIIDSLKQIKGESPLADNADEIEIFLSTKEQNLYLEEGLPSEVTNWIKQEAQLEALEAVEEAGGSGMVLGATGFGKSKVAIMKAAKLIEKNPDAAITIVVPTQQLRDNNWPAEFEKWGYKEIFEKNVGIYCYVSINKLEDTHCDLCIMDEAHNITMNNSEYFAQNTVLEVIALTATEPRDEEKKSLLRSLGLDIVYNMPLDTAVKLKLVSPYELYIIETELDTTDKYILAGSKAKPFYTTESGQYAYLTKSVNQAMFSADLRKLLPFRTLKRMRFIYDLRSKTKVAQWVLDNIISPDETTLVFAGGIPQANELALQAPVISKKKTRKSTADVKYEPVVQHSKVKGDKWLQAFMAGEVNRLVAVNSLNEGINVNVKVNNALIVQVNSNEKDLVQRIGRIIRYLAGHIAKVYIVVVTGTKDEDWVKKATENMKPLKKTYVRFKNLLEGATI